MAALLGCATMSFAQNNYVATLQHEGEFTHYYGSGALTSAYNAATEGDIITLSPGTFSSPGTIDKGITLRGPGIGKGIARSYISGETTFCATDSSRIVKVEGIHFSYRSYVKNNASGNGQGKIIFMKSLMSGLIANAAGTYSTDKGPAVRFYNVDFGDIFYYESNSYPDIFVYNSWVRNPHSNFGETTSAFMNCVVHYDGDAISRAYNMNFYNCIFYFSGAPLNSAYGAYYASLPNSATCYNCLSVDKSNLFDKQIYGGNNNTSTSSKVWNSAENHDWCELTEEARNTYLGTDGTQVGFYGGNYPWNTDVQYPIITQFNTDVQTSKEGILNINVEVDGK